MENRRVNEIMVPLDKYPRVHEWDTLLDAIRAFQNCQVETEQISAVARVVLVFNLENQLVGMARRRDIMRNLEPHFLSHQPLATRKNLFTIEMDPNLLEFSWDKLMDGIIEKTNHPILDVMRPIEHTVDVNDHIIKAIYEIVDNNVSTLPVTENGEVIGVLRTEDVFNELSNLILTDE